MKLKTLYPILEDAREKFNFAMAGRIAELMGIKYHWSEEVAPIASQSDLEIMLSTLTSQAERSFQENLARGNGKKPISIASGGFTLTATWWGEQDTPQVIIHFGLNAQIHGATL